jgi:pyruvyl transferase EpsO
MTRPDTLDLIGALQAQIHQTLAPYFDGSPFAIVDFPDIRNVGDSAIWLGEIAYLDSRQAGARPAYVSRMWDFSADELARAVGDGVIFIHGGGNFGDIWESHQDFREMILERFPHNRIVQFPQSIHFNSQERLEKAARIAERHKNFTLLVRDWESKEIAERRLGLDAPLCPDMAFCIGPITRAGPPREPILAMLRDDSEAAGLDRSSVNGVQVEDWITEWRPGVRLSKLLGLASTAVRTPRSAPPRFHMLHAAARNRLQRGRRQLSKGGVIITDRLHVHIVSLLMGIPHAVLDNSYGKVTRFMNAFSGGTSLTHRSSSLQDALEWARRTAQADAA